MKTIEIDGKAFPILVEPHTMPYLNGYQIVWTTI